MSANHTNRYVAYDTVKKIEYSKDGSAAITGESGWTAGCSAQTARNLSFGVTYGLETKGGPFGRICGWLIDGTWFDRKSDEDLHQEHLDLMADIDRRHREMLAKNRVEWADREAALPDWLRERLATFHERGGDKFELNGWGYELTVCELAALYARSGREEESAAVNAYAEREGTSGNQHDVAKALVRSHVAGQSLAGTISALSPLTGDAFYDKAKS